MKNYFEVEESLQESITQVKPECIYTKKKYIRPVGEMW